MKKVLVLGSGGMLGHMVYNYFKTLNKYNLIDASFPQKVNPTSHLLDVTKKNELEAFLKNTKPDYVINCIGILLRGSKGDPSNAIYLNAYLPHQLSKLLRPFGGKLIHMSTDCVFTGEKGAYVESDLKDARDTYGLSKALGEVDNNNDLTLRTSIIGPDLKVDGEGLFQWFMNQDGIVNGFTKMIWGGVTTLELAKTIDAAIEQNITGLIHITNGVPISKYGLISLVKEIWETNQISIKPVDGKFVDKSLKSERQDFSYKVLSYEEMLKEQLEWMHSHPIQYAKNPS